MSSSRVLRQARRAGLIHPLTPSRPVRWGSSYEPPNPTPPQPGGGNPHRNFYKSFGRPVAKVFLGSMFTYQLLYWSWLKLEAVEIKKEKTAELNSLQTQLEQIRSTKPTAAKS
ncbi:hypothetical protein BDY21DRAFT_365973 [Lineolata rhizophorae]|uniref:Uncharacterized protein n=1 Tax=Lineolata rhizophorae TaxID=578093 RepID=A0A6A6NTZ4_9PEZI|nr:hypothetical protein BDY21DRAFT_365973 [Lineolata rhizophorae]